MLNLKTFCVIRSWPDTCSEIHSRIYLIMLIKVALPFHLVQIPATVSLCSYIKQRDGAHNLWIALQNYLWARKLKPPLVLIQLCLSKTQINTNPDSSYNMKSSECIWGPWPSPSLSIWSTSGTKAPADGHNMRSSTDAVGCHITTSLKH